MLDKLLGKNVFVLGLGKSGMSSLIELKKRGVHVIAWDDNKDLRMKAGNFGAQLTPPEEFDFTTAALLLLSPAISRKHYAYQAATAAGIPIITDVELFVSSHKGEKFIGITGTNGKSTTTALVYHILKENNVPAVIGGNFGIAVFDMPKLPKGGWYVLELSSYQLELVPSLDLDIAAWLNLTTDHIDRHGSMEAYFDAKFNIMKRAHKKKYTNVIALDDEYTRRVFKMVEKDPHATNIPVSFDRKVPGPWVNVRGVLMDDGKELLDTTRLENLKGKHNRQNIAVAFAIARAAGIPDAGIAKAITSFKNLSHRMENIGEVAGIRFINDSKATNAESTRWALGSYDEIYWILGGKPKDDGIEPLTEIFTDERIKRAFTIGAAGKDFHKVIKRDIDSYRCGKLDKAVAKAFKLALKDLKKGRVVNPVILLSPSAASFDQYESFEARGEHFRRLFEELKAKHES